MINEENYQKIYSDVSRPKQSEIYFGNKCYKKHDA